MSRLLLSQGAERHARSRRARVPSAVQTQPRPNKRQRGGEEDEGEDGEGFVPADMTARILKQARSQQEELDAEEMPAGVPRHLPPLDTSRPCVEGAGISGHCARHCLQEPEGLPS